MQVLLSFICCHSEEVLRFASENKAVLLNSESFLPQFSDPSTQKDTIAECYFGIRDLLPRQKLALLFQTEEGTANPLVLKPDDHITWSYLSDNNWKEFSIDPVVDATGQLLRSGVIRFDMPADASTEHNLLPSGLTWLRASITREREAVNELVAVHTQAALAEFKDQGNDPEFLNTPLPAKTISKLQRRISGIKKLDQPYPSFGGRGKEAAVSFYTRVSERLRHKDRGVAIWDYERLVLQAFPEVYRVKCISHAQLDAGEDGSASIYAERAPGHVLIIPIARRNTVSEKPVLKPFTTLDTLAKIRVFLEQRVSSFVRLHVANARFEEVRTDFSVKFHEGFDAAAYKVILNNDLLRFLSPWAFSESFDISFGGSWRASSIIDFIEERPYVDFLTDFKLLHFPEEGNAISNVVEEAVATTARSVLVSSGQHNIKDAEGC